MLVVKWLPYKVHKLKGQITLTFGVSPTEATWKSTGCPRPQK